MPSVCVCGKQLYNKYSLTRHEKTCKVVQDMGGVEAVAPPKRRGRPPKNASKDKSKEAKGKPIKTVPKGKKPAKAVSKDTPKKKRGRPRKVDKEDSVKVAEPKSSKKTVKPPKTPAKTGSKKAVEEEVFLPKPALDFGNDADDDDDEDTESSDDEESDSDDITVEMLMNNRFRPPPRPEASRPVLRQRLVPLKPMPYGSDGESVISHPSTDSDGSRRSYQPQLVPRLDPYAPIVMQPKKKLTDPDQGEKLEKLSEKDNVQPKDIINAIDKLREDVYQLQLRHQMLNIMLDMHQNIIDGLEYDMEHKEESDEESSSDEDDVTYHPAGLFGHQGGQNPFRGQPAFPARAGGSFQQASNILDDFQRIQGNNWLAGLTAAINKANAAEYEDSDDE